MTETIVHFNGRLWQDPDMAAWRFKPVSEQDGRRIWEATIPGAGRKRVVARVEEKNGDIHYYLEETQC